MSDGTSGVGGANANGGADARYEAADNAMQDGVESTYDSLREAENAAEAAKAGVAAGEICAVEAAATRAEAAAADAQAKAQDVTDFAATQSTAFADRATAAARDIADAAVQAASAAREALDTMRADTGTSACVSDAQPTNPTQGLALNTIDQLFG